MILQLNPPIPMTTPKGPGLAHFLIDYSAEHDLYWVIFLDNSGECWTFSNRHVRAQGNITLGRKSVPNIFNVDNADDNEHASHVYKPPSTQTNALIHEKSSERVSSMGT